MHSAASLNKPAIRTLHVLQSVIIFLGAKVLGENTLCKAITCFQVGDQEALFRSAPERTNFLG